MSEMYVANRDVPVTSTSGHTIRFIKDDPKEVPMDMRRLCMERGVLPVGGVAPVVEDDTPKPKKVAPTQLEEREELIRVAMQEMIDAKRRTDFTAAGLPRADQLAKITGFEVSPAERDRIWLGMKRG